MGKAVDGDNARTYLETTLGSALDKLDAHDHSGTTKGLAVFAGPLTITANGLTVMAGNVGIGGSVAANVGLAVTGTTVTSSAGAYGVYVSPTLTATATSDPLASLTIASTYVPGAQTSTSILGISILANAAAQASATKYGIFIGSQTGANTNNYGIFVGVPSGASGANIGIYNAGAMVVGGNATPTVGAGLIGFSGATSATVGANGASAALTANPLGYMVINVAGVAAKIPYYNS